MYVGVTNNLVKRVYEHKNDLVEGFTKKHQVHNLIYFEPYKDINEAILREKQMKKWKRYWKIRLVNKANPEWRDLYSQII